MVNADEAEEAPVRSESTSSRLPPQLNRLPTDQLAKVQGALQELQAVGLTDLKDIAALSQCVKANTGTAGNARLPAEDLTSDYMGNNLWAWTPKRWRDSIEAQGPAAGAKSEELGNDNSNDSEDKLPPLPANLQERLDRHIARLTQKEDRASMVEQLNAFFERMKQNDAEIRSLATMDRESMPTQKGDGPSVWFDFTRTAPVGFKALKPPPPEVKAYVAVSMTGNHFAHKRNVASSVVCLHLGAEGSDIGAACWKRLMNEHLLDGRGRPSEGAFFGSSFPFFAESTTGRYVPRAVFAGYERARMDAVSSAGLFAPSSVLVGGEVDQDFCSGERDCCFGDEIMDSIRRQMEQADFVEGFLMTHSSGEGLATGGLTNKLLSDISVSYGKLAKMTLTAVPDLEGNDQVPLATSALLSDNLLEFTDLVNFYDQESLPKAAKSGEQSSSVVARLFSGLTGPMRFGRSVTASQGSRLSSLLAIQTNLVCYPRIHFALPGLACGSAADGGYEAAAAALGAPLCSVEKGKSIAFAMMGRGAEQSCLISRVAAYKLSKECDFVDYCPTGFAVSTYKDAKSDQAEISVLQNTTAASQVFAKFSDGLMNCKGQGLEGAREEGQTMETLENLAALMKDYQEISDEYKEEEDDGEEEEEEEE